ncbi:hypothetical protein CS8_005430 [Cupriavidus sp. 8B]
MGRLDVAIHSITFAPKNDLKGGLLNSSAEGFAQAMDVSCHSFIRMARLAAPLMDEGGALFAMSYLGATRVVPNYDLMDPVKAALEATCRYLARELGPKRFRVKKQKISGGTRSELGRQCRDTFSSLKKTCRKLGISFWDYFADRNSHQLHSPPSPHPRASHRSLHLSRVVPFASFC